MLWGHDVIQQLGEHPGDALIRARTEGMPFQHCGFRTPKDEQVRAVTSNDYFYRTNRTRYNMRTRTREGGI